MEKTQDKGTYNSGPWTYNEEEHCLLDSKGTVIAEFYEDDSNGFLVASTINMLYFKDKSPKN